MTAWQYKDETGRVCSKCETYKPWEEFNKGRPECRQCQKRLAKLYRRDPVKTKEAYLRWKAKKGSSNVRTTQEKDS